MNRPLTEEERKRIEARQAKRAASVVGKNESGAYRVEKKNGKAARRETR